MTTPQLNPEDRCDWSGLPRYMCAGKECEGTPWPGNLDAPAPAPVPRTIVRWSPKDDKKPETRDWSDGPKAPGKGTRCRWSKDHHAHLLPSHLLSCTDRNCNGCEPCTHDDQRNPVKHCGTVIAARVCSEHLDHDHPRTCPRCIGRVRAALTQIENLTALMPDQAVIAGVDSTATMLAGPAADPDRIERRGILLVRATSVADPATSAAGRKAHQAVAAWEADVLDERHPAYVCRQWELLIREHTGSGEPRFTEQEVADPRLVGTDKPPTLTTSIGYLSWVLTDIAQDPDIDFQQLAAEITQCLSHLEAVLGASRTPERGAPCKDCDEPAPRLIRRRAHWCDRDDCTREHDTTGARDTWVCPRNPGHWWTEADYRKWSYERADENKGRMGA